MKTLHIWEKDAVRLAAERRYENPYTEVDVWIDLSGPGFEKRVYGFWDGGDSFEVRFLATVPGRWSWMSGSNTDDPGLSGRTGEFEAVEWSGRELAANPTRRGFIRPTANGRGFELADGTPFVLLGDTWWAVPTFRYPWFEDDRPRPFGPEMGFKDMVAYRKAQGFNSIAILAAFPAWANDGLPANLRMDDELGTAVRGAWREPGTESAKDMHNEGGRPFLFPGKVPGYERVVPDFDRINPDYFRFMDRKIDHLNAAGFFPFVEAVRRDISEAWKRYGDWPLSYARYIHYVFARLQANNCLLSPIHFDWDGFSIPSREYNEPANMVIDRWGPPPFGTLLGTNAAPSTLVNFGGPDEARWLTFHQLGNWREHDHYWYLGQIHRSVPAMPAVNGEPFYPGFPNDDPPAPSREATLNFRSGLYGGFLSGGFGGYLYGAEGLWGGDGSPKARYRMWEALEFESGDQVRHLKAFIEGVRWWELEPDHELVTPNKSGPALGYRGWAFCARTADYGLLLYFFEKGCPPATVRGLEPEAAYELTWFDPAAGFWLDGPVTLKADRVGRIVLPPFPREEDQGMRLKLTNDRGSRSRIP